MGPSPTFNENLQTIIAGRDWSEYYVNYGHFKNRLVEFSNRRSKLRRRTLMSPRERLPREQFESIVEQFNPPTTPRYYPPPEPEPAITPHPLMTPYAQCTAETLSVIEEEGSISLGTTASRTRTRRGGFFKYRTVVRLIAQEERAEVVPFLDAEIQKCACFYFAKVADLKLPQYTNFADQQLFGGEILELFAFVTVNLVTIRQILIRYDAFVRTFGGTPLSSYYVKQVEKYKPTVLVELVKHRALLHVTEAFQETLTRYSTSTEESRDFFIKFSDQLDMFTHIMVDTRRALFESSNGHMIYRDTLVQTLRDFFLLGSIAESLGLEPNFLTIRGRDLNPEIEMVAEWRQNRKSEKFDRHRHRDKEKKVDTMSSQQIFDLTLNMLSGFFYCMNYYIVEPSSTQYVNALGSQDAMSGLLIGAMPIAALISSVAYSMWTNHSFRYPLICSGVCLIAGNLIYVSAFSYKSIHVALAGRFLTGLGCPKCIVRRYMADTTAVSMRTSVNAAFGTATAVGSALGPATAILLDRLDFQVKIRSFGALYVNGMTGPGVLMFSVWILFTLVVVLSFAEPDRAGLEEQKNLEQKKAARKSSITSSGDLFIEGTPSTLKEMQSFSSSTGIGKKEDAIRRKQTKDDDVNTIFSGAEADVPDVGSRGPRTINEFLELVTFPLQLCLFLLFAKTFTIESLVSATSALTKNRYGWKIKQVGTLGCMNGLLVIPLSILVGWLSTRYQDRTIMAVLLCVAIAGEVLLIDISDLISTDTSTYNEGNPLAVGPRRYVSGYFLAFSSIQAIEGVVGSALSKVIPTALATGTINSGLLATLVGTGGRALGDVFISAMGFLNIRHLMNLLFITSFCVLVACFGLLRHFYDVLAV